MASPQPPSQAVEENNNTHPECVLSPLELLFEQVGQIRQQVRQEHLRRRNAVVCTCKPKLTLEDWKRRLWLKEAELEFYQENLVMKEVAIHKKSFDAKTDKEKAAAIRKAKTATADIRKRIKNCEKCIGAIKRRINDEAAKIAKKRKKVKEVRLMSVNEFVREDKPHPEDLEILEELERANEEKWAFLWGTDKERRTGGRYNPVPDATDDEEEEDAKMGLFTAFKRKHPCICHICHILGL